jgi:dTDP-4-dehydrorhamnose 3,5-epimerase
MGDILVKNSKLIEGVFFEPLQQIKDDRGAVFHHLKHTSPSFKGFEEVYISKTFPGKIKAWKKHLKMTQNFCVPVGCFKFVLFDDRDGSTTFNICNEFRIDDDKDYQLLSIPPNVWYGFQCLSDSSSIIVNLTNLAFDATEVIKLDINNQVIPYNNWANLQD